MSWFSLMFHINVFGSTDSLRCFRVTASRDRLLTLLAPDAKA